MTKKTIILLVVLGVALAMIAVLGGIAAYADGEEFLTGVAQVIFSSYTLAFIGIAVLSVVSSRNKTRPLVTLPQNRIMRCVHQDEFWAIAGCIDTMRITTDAVVFLRLAKKAVTILKSLTAISLPDPDRKLADTAYDLLAGLVAKRFRRLANGDPRVGEIEELLREVEFPERCWRLLADM